jgi:hypothetical protein
MANFITGIISITIGLVLVASVFIYTVNNTTTTGWSASTIVMWGLLPLIAVVGILYGVLNVFGIA